MRFGRYAIAVWQSIGTRRPHGDLETSNGIEVVVPD
jgi:hypothetical protein